jgi:4-amino-4-deoxy-L-arabinose transferase-like glycosyltransferase
LGIIGSALLLRIGFILWSSAFLGNGQTLSVDALAYHQCAQNLVERQIFTSPVDPPYNPQLPSTFRPPLTSLYLAVIYWLSGVHLLWGQIGLAVASAMACGLTYRLGALLFNATVGLVAAGISCFYPLFLLLTYLPLTEGLSILLSIATLTLLYTAESGVQRIFSGRECWLGIIVGLAILNKTTNAALLASILLLELGQRPGTFRQHVMRMLFVGAVASILILPWTIRNYLATGALIPINSNGGWTFYLGNNPYTEQNLADLEQGRTNGWAPPQEVFRPFADLAFTDTAAWEKRSQALGYAFIHDHPGQFLNFALRKLKIFWSPYQHIFDRLTWYPLLAFALIGLISSCTAWKKHVSIYALIFLTTLIPVLFTSMPRFRAPIMPVMIIYSAVGLINVYQGAKQKLPNLIRRIKT